MAKPTLRGLALLLKLDLYRLGGWNEFVHTRDPKEKRRWLINAFVWGLLAIMAVGYLLFLAWGMLLLGFGEALPGFLYTMASALTLLLGILNIGNFLFSHTFHDQISTLPIPHRALPLSRLLALYLVYLALCALCLVPGMVVYAMALQPGILFWAAFLWGLLLAPLPCLTVACIPSVLSALFVRRLRYKPLIATLILVLYLVVAMNLSFQFDSTSMDPNDPTALLLAMKPLLTASASRYPPAAWFSQILSGSSGSGSALLRLSLTALLPAGLAAAIIVRRYDTLCNALNAVAGRRRANRRTTVHIPLTALYLREVRRYTTCMTWFSNTAIGYCLMAAIPLMLLLSGDRFGRTMGLTSAVIIRYLPLVLGLLAILMPVTSCAIFLEGAQWPLIRTLPVRTRDLLLAKVLLNLTVAFPCWLIAVIGGTLALHPQGPDLLWLALVPAVYCVYGAVAALRIDLAFPKLQAKNETEVVKQSTATLLSLLNGLISAGIPWLLLVTFPHSVVYTGLCPLAALLTLFLWRQCLHTDLQKIQ